MLWPWLRGIATPEETWHFDSGWFRGNPIGSETYDPTFQRVTFNTWLVNLWAYPLALQKEMQLRGIHCTKVYINFFIQSMLTSMWKNLELHSKADSQLPKIPAQFHSELPGALLFYLDSFFAGFIILILFPVEKTHLWSKGSVANWQAEKKLLQSKGRIIWVWKRRLEVLLHWMLGFVQYILRHRAYSSKLQGTNMCDSIRRVNQLRIQEPNAYVGSADACSKTFQQK